MTSRYVAKWKWIKKINKKRNPGEHGNVSLGNDEWTNIIRMRLVLRGFQDPEAFDLDTFFRYGQKKLATDFGT